MEIIFSVAEINLRTYSRRIEICNVKIMPKLAVLKNAEKDRFVSEKWDAKRDIAAIPHPFRLLALGGVGRGKTNTLKNIFLAHQDSKYPFHELFIVGPDSSSEWDDCDPTETLNELPGPDKFDPRKKTLLVIDDYECVSLSASQKRALSTLFRYVSSHCNVSIMLSFQSFVDAPQLARKTANCFALYQPTSRGECSVMCSRAGLDKGVLKTLFDGLCHSPYDSIMVDRTIASPAPIRLNVYQPVDLVEDE